MNIKRISLILLGAALVCTMMQAQTSTSLERARRALGEVKASHAPDKRQIVYEIEAESGPGGVVAVKGVTSEQAAYDATVAALNAAYVAFTDSMRVYPSDRWALVRIPAASLRTQGRHAAEMATQAVLGTPLRVLEQAGEWFRVQTPDGYIAYVPSSSIVERTDTDMAAWRAANRYVVTAPYQIRVYTTPDNPGLRDVVSDLVNGCIIEDADDQAPGVGRNGYIHIKLPDGRKGYVAADAITPIAEWAAQPFDAQKILDIAYSMEGTPYLWGGTSTKALDCSGLAKVSYLSNGIILMRDASQQALTGTRIEAADWHDCEAGDLLFFGTRSGRVTHVAIYDEAGNYVHSSGRVKRNSVDPESDSYLTTPFLHAVRIHGNEGTPGITRAADHPWYF